MKMAKTKRRNVLDIDVNKSTYNQVLFDAVTLNNIDNIRYAISLGARIEDRNNRGQTALDLAVSLGRRPLVDELLRLGADINQKNARDNTCIYEQMKLEEWDMVNYLFSKDGVRVNERNTSGKSYLHLAVSMGNVDLVKDLLIMGSAVNMKSNDGRTPLHFAAIHGEVECAKLLIALGGDINEKDTHNNTPLIFAAKYHLDDIVEFLVFREAKVAGFNLDGESALKLVSVQGEGELMNKMLDSLIEQSKPNLSIVVNELMRIKENMDKVDELGLFMYIYGKLSSDSSFDELVGFEMIVILHSPIKYLNWMIKEDSTGRECHLTKLLLRRFYSLHQERTILRFLLRLNYFTLKCATRHEIEQKSLHEFADRVEQAIGMLFSADNLDNHTQVLKLLMPEVTQKDHHRLLEFARCFQNEGLLSYCLSNHLKILFDKPQVAGIVEKLFLTPLRETIVPGDISKSFDLKSLRLRRSLFLRSCPAAMYCLDFISKVIAITLVGYISINIYGKRYGLNYRIKHDVYELQQLEMWMIIMIVTSILHELGELIDSDFSLTHYLQDQWNVYDLLEYALCLGWIILRFIPGYFNNARIMLALAAIPQSQGLLRYLSVYRPIGELVIIVKAMMVDLIVFLIIYSTSIFGFGIAFAGMFYSPENHTFGTNIQTLLSLFSFTLGNFEFNVFNATSKVVNTIGTLLMMIFITMTAVVLINLLIARMTSSHERVHEQALREWSFSQAQTVSSLLLWTEKNPLSMLPPPFNFFSAVFGLIDVYLLPLALENHDAGMSLAGTASNIILTCLVGTLLRTIQFMSRTLHKVLGFHVNVVVRVISLFTLLTTLVWYPFYDWLSLMQEPGLFFIDRIDENRVIIYQPFQPNRDVIRTEEEQEENFDGNQIDTGMGDYEEEVEGEVGGDDDGDLDGDADIDGPDNNGSALRIHLQSPMAPFRNNLDLEITPTNNFRPPLSRSPILNTSGLTPRPLLVYPPSSHLPSPAMPWQHPTMVSRPLYLHGVVTGAGSAPRTPREMVSGNTSITTVDEPSLSNNVSVNSKQPKHVNTKPTMTAATSKTIIHQLAQQHVHVDASESKDNKELDRRRLRASLNSSPSAPNGSPFALFIDSDDEEIHHRRLQKNGRNDPDSSIGVIFPKPNHIYHCQHSTPHNQSHSSGKPQSTSTKRHLSQKQQQLKDSHIYRQDTHLPPSNQHTLIGKIGHHTSSFFLQLSGTGSATAMAMLQQGEGYHLNEIDRKMIGQKLQSTLTAVQINALENIAAEAKRNSSSGNASPNVPNLSDKLLQKHHSKYFMQKEDRILRRQERIQRRQQRLEHVNKLQHESAAKRQSYMIPSHSLRLRNSDRAISEEEEDDDAQSKLSEGGIVNEDALVLHLKNSNSHSRYRLDEDLNNVIDSVLASDQEYDSDLDDDEDEDEDDPVCRRHGSQMHNKSHHTNNNNIQHDNSHDNLLAVVTGDDSSGSWEGSLGSSEEGHDVTFIFSIRDVRSILQVFLASWEPAADAEINRIEAWKEIDSWVFRVCKAPPAVHSSMNHFKPLENDTAAQGMAMEPPGDESAVSLKEEHTQEQHVTAHPTLHLHDHSDAFPAEEENIHAHSLQRHHTHHKHSHKKSKLDLLSPQNNNHGIDLDELHSKDSKVQVHSKFLSHKKDDLSTSSVSRGLTIRQFGRDNLVVYPPNNNSFSSRHDTAKKTSNNETAIKQEKEILEKSFAKMTAGLMENSKQLHDSLCEKMSSQMHEEVSVLVAELLTQHLSTLQQHFQEEQQQRLKDKLDSEDTANSNDYNNINKKEEESSNNVISSQILDLLSSQLQQHDEQQARLASDILTVKSELSELTEVMDTVLRTEQISVRRDVTNIRDNITSFIQEFDTIKKDGTNIKHDVSTLKTGLKRDVVMMKQDFSCLKEDVHVLKQDVQRIGQDLATLLRILQDS